MDQWITSFSDSSIHTVRPGKNTAAGQTEKREDKKVEKYLSLHSPVLTDSVQVTARLKQ